MRVLFVTQYFPPESGAAPARALHFARALERAGHEVRVVTGLPNHPSGVVQPAYQRVRRASERAGGVAIERVWLHATPRRTPVTRLWNHLSFALSALGPALAGPRPDLVLATMPPLFLGVTAWLAARRHGAPLVLDCRDDWPAAAVALGEMRAGFAARVLEGLARFLQRRAARVLAVTPGMLRAFERAGLDAGRLVLATNGADTDLFRPAPVGGAREAGRPLTVLYAGTHGLIHGMEALLDAAERLRARGDLRFLLVGDGVAKPGLERRARAAGLGQVEFRPSVAPERLVEEIHAADVCVATTRDHAFCGETIPVKLFDYLACGRPVVAAVSGDAARMVVESGAGVVVPPGDGAALADALVALAADPARRAALGAAGPAFVEERYSRRAVGAKLEALLDEVVRLARGREVAPRPAGPGGAAKRAVDVFVAAALLVVLAPLLAAVALAVRLDSPGPALFRQRRVGRASREFTILKFRTMRVGTPDLASHLMGPGSDRVTRVGRWLRRTSLDELPQLLNVLAGDMTLVGPRPALHNQHDLVALRQQAGVDALKPGVTGWAQIHGRDDLPLDRKVAYDRWYLEHVSFGLDLGIALRTPFALFSSRGVF
jgi:lipopolysaccharide/colanic/teichoic acid biosynthesis glycosyltransferase